MNTPNWQPGLVRTLRHDFNTKLEMLPAGEELRDDKPFVVITRAAIERRLGRKLGHEVWLEVGPTIEGIIASEMVGRKPYPELSEPCISEIMRVIRGHLSKPEPDYHGQKPETD